MDMLSKPENLILIGVALGVLAVALPILGRFVSTWYPRLGEALIRLGADLRGAREAVRLPRSMPAPSSLPMPSEPPPAPPADSRANGKLPPVSTMMLICLALVALGCASPLDAAVQVQHAGAAAIEHGGEELQERCTDRLVPLAELPTLAERQAAAAPIREVCDPARMAYGSARAAHVLLSATLAALAGGVTVGELVDLTSQTARALAELATTFARLRGKP